MPFTDVLDRLGKSYTGKPNDPRLRWREMARHDQLPPAGDWHIWYVKGGRGSGKTRSGAGEMADWVLSDTDGEGEYGIIAPTYADAWTKCVEGESGLLRALGTSMAEIKDHRSKTVRSAWRTYGQVVMRNGIVVYVDSAAEGGLRIQGRNLKGAWCDEIGLWLNWETAWNESLRYAVRMGRAQIIATATPKASRPARRLIRSLLRNDPEHGGVVVTSLRTMDNADNLSDKFLRSVVGAAQGTRLERQELEGELLDDVANALWTRDLLDSIRIPALRGHLRGVYLGCDPSDGSEDSDEHAYTIFGQGMPEDPHYYVAENWGGQEDPATFAKRCIRKAMEWNATIVVEKNHGGKWLTTVFRQVQKEMGTSVRVMPVHASDAKRTRAEPVAALYTRYSTDGTPLVLHVHQMRERYGQRIPDDQMPELEDQMATFTGAQGERSPDRLDSLVWAATHHLNTGFGVPGPSGPRKWAAQRELDEMTVTPISRAARRLAGAHGGAYAGLQEATLDDFAPADDVPGGHGPRDNVRRWR